MCTCQLYLAVANHGSSRHRPSKSLIYVWSRRRQRFRLHQELTTWSARDLEYFNIDHRHFLIVANDPAHAHSKFTVPRSNNKLHIVCHVINYKN